ncbi:glutathione S-transferase F13-like [Syzygium oleosum]|uniref:glutathione S-transferase F13-like n=1 Tax=Syzygium oleosum TaxID=219896 RepID=UPI0011D279AF|nr:glutathione S-transferase F13-like [Syzygium oleosum]XP_056170281.1 glutathione S-transferase F13-like [Syzygium oleosum]
MGVKLYGHPMSSCTLRVMACLYEKGVDFELVPVNMFAGEQKMPDFLAKNPFGKVPVLEDGDLTIFESRAITEYISKKYKSPGTEDLLRSDSPEESVTVRVWVEVESHHFQPVMSPIIFQHFVVPLQGKVPDQALIDDHLAKLAGVLDVYEARLAKTKFLAGDFFSLADLHHFPYMYYFMKTPWAAAVTDRPRVKAWWEEMSGRAAFKKVDEGMKFGEDKK